MTLRWSGKRSSLNKSKSRGAGQHLQRVGFNRRLKQKVSHSGSTLDSFLEDEGIREEVEAVAIMRVRAWQQNRRASLDRTAESLP